MGRKPPDSRFERGKGVGMNNALLLKTRDGGQRKSQRASGGEQTLRLVFRVRDGLVGVNKALRRSKCEMEDR